MYASCGDCYCIIVSYETTKYHIPEDQTCVWLQSVRQSFCSNASSSWGLWEKELCWTNSKQVLSASKQGEISSLPVRCAAGCGKSKLLLGRFTVLTTCMQETTAASPYPSNKSRVALIAPSGHWHRSKWASILFRLLLLSFTLVVVGYLLCSSGRRPPVLVLVFPLLIRIRTAGNWCPLRCTILPTFRRN